VDSPDSDSGFKEGRVVLGPGWDLLDLQQLDDKKKPAPAATEEPGLSTSVGSSSGWVAEFEDEL